MIARRYFLSLSLVAFAGLSRASAAASAKKTPNSLKTGVFTKNVREVTRKLRIERGRWKMIVCHHSGIRDGNAKTYDRAHRKRGMENGLAYHFVIGNGIDSEDGKIEIGGRWLKQIQGGHVRSDAVNKMAIGICLVGNFDKTKPSKNQWTALCELIDYLRNEVAGQQLKVMGHAEVDPRHTACPGRLFPLKQLHELYRLGRA